MTVSLSCRICHRQVESSMHIGVDIGVCKGLQNVYAQMREIDGAKDWREGGEA